MTLKLANLSTTSERQLLIQAGGYGEHRFTWLRELAEGAPGESRHIYSGVLEVILPPGAIIQLELGLERYCRNPSFTEPWDRS